jgi:hypothetical protein
MPWLVRAPTAKEVEEFAGRVKECFKCVTAHFLYHNAPCSLCDVLTLIIIARRVQGRCAGYSVHDERDGTRSCSQSPAK